jgi:hypothetical protein
VHDVRVDTAMCPGDHSNWVFGLLPAVLTYPASGINTNLQWCGQGFSQLPNGIGFGGQVRPWRSSEEAPIKSCTSANKCIDTVHSPPAAQAVPSAMPVCTL